MTVGEVWLDGVKIAPTLAGNESRPAAACHNAGVGIVDAADLTTWLGIRFPCLVGIGVE
jgi:hypothetical protein